MIAFVVAALMGIMLIHILKESIPALREVGIKMFLQSSEWRPVSAAPQYGLLPAVTGTLYVSGLAVLFAMILGVACACFLTFFMPKKLASVCLAFYRSGGRDSIGNLRVYRIDCTGKKHLQNI